MTPTRIKPTKRVKIFQMPIFLRVEKTRIPIRFPETKEVAIINKVLIASPISFVSIESSDDATSTIIKVIGATNPQKILVIITSQAFVKALRAFL